MDKAYCCISPGDSITVGETQRHVYLRMEGNNFARVMVLSPSDTLAFARQMEQIALRLIEQQSKEKSEASHDRD